MLFKPLPSVYLLLVAFPLFCAAIDQPSPAGFLEGHLHIYSPKVVEPQDGNVPTVTPETYAQFPLVVFSQENDNQEYTRITADSAGNYRVALPPGGYVLDVLDRKQKHVRATPQHFTVVSNQTVRVDLEMDTGIR